MKYFLGNCTSVQMASVDPATPVVYVGQGSKPLQFFYENPLTDIKIGFPPVRVNTEEEINCVVALVSEKADEFNRRNNIKKSGKPVQYYSSAVQARSILPPEIVKHIEKCFTKKGMKDMNPGRKKRVYPKRKEIIKVPSNYYNIKQEIDDTVADNEETAEYEEDEEDEEQVDEVEEQPEEYVPTGREMKTDVEEAVFGGCFPEVELKNKPQGLSERTGRGGRNETVKNVKNAPEHLVKGAVEYMLDPDNKTKEGSLNLNSLFKKRGRRRKKRADVDAFSDEDDYVAPKHMVNTSSEGSRKSKRITNFAEVMQSMQDDTGAVDDKENHTPTEEIDENSCEETSTTVVESDKEESTATRDMKLEEIREIVTEKLIKKNSPVSETVPEAVLKTGDHKFTEPGSGSEDEQGKKEKQRLKRGRERKEAGSDEEASKVRAVIDTAVL